MLIPGIRATAPKGSPKTMKAIPTTLNIILKRMVTTPFIIIGTYLLGEMSILFNIPDSLLSCTAATVSINISPADSNLESIAWSMAPPSLPVSLVMALTIIIIPQTPKIPVINRKTHAPATIGNGKPMITRTNPINILMISWFPLNLATRKAAPSKPTNGPHTIRIAPVRSLSTVLAFSGSSGS